MNEYIRLSFIEMSSFFRLCSHNSFKIDLCIFTTLSMFDGCDSCWIQHTHTHIQKKRPNKTIRLYYACKPIRIMALFFFALRSLSAASFECQNRLLHLGWFVSVSVWMECTRERAREKTKNICRYSEGKKNFRKRTRFYRLQCQLLMSTKYRMWKLSYAIKKKAYFFLWRL